VEREEREKGGLGGFRNEVCPKRSGRNKGKRMVILERLNMAGGEKMPTPVAEHGAPHWSMARKENPERYCKQKK